MPETPCLNPQQFTNLLLSQLPVYSQPILRDVRPTDGLMGHINTGTWAAFSGTQQTQDRFRNVKANLTKKWEDVVETACVGSPCDPTEHEICWGWDRLVYGQQRQSWRSQLLCFDQMLSATQAVEHIEQIVGDILRPATSDIGSFYVRKKSLELAGNKVLANATMSPFTWTWETSGDAEIYGLPSAWPTSKLTPEMLQRQFMPLSFQGYFGKWTNDPFWGEYNQFAELITDADTAWSFDRVTTNQRLSDMFRFTSWGPAHDYFKYGMVGSVGNYMVHQDPFPLRFMRRNDGRAQIVLPFENVSATVGLGSQVNPDYLNAQYQMSFIWHRFAWQLQVQDMQSINPLMPFMVRGLNGQWNFAIDNLGADCEGNAIANYRKNKGFFYADFRWAGKPLHTEWMTVLFHKREPMVIYTVDTCATDPGYPTQDYNSACDPCDNDYTWFLGPQDQDDGNYVIAANTIACEGEAPLTHAAISVATVALLATALEAQAAVAALGTWTADGDRLILTDASCRPSLPFVT